MLLLLPAACRDDALLRAGLAVGTTPAWLARACPGALKATVWWVLYTLTSMTTINIRITRMSTPSTATPAMAPVPLMLEKASAPPCCCCSAAAAAAAAPAIVAAALATAMGGDRREVEASGKGVPSRSALSARALAMAAAEPGG
jgi:hypothetical protein